MRMGAARLRWVPAANLGSGEVWGAEALRRRRFMREGEEASERRKKMALPRSSIYRGGRGNRRGYGARCPDRVRRDNFVASCVCV